MVAMSRRTFLASGAAVLAASLGVGAEQQTTPLVAIVQGAFAEGDLMPRILGGVAPIILGDRPFTEYDLLRKALHEAGYVDGQNVRITIPTPAQTQADLYKVVSRVLQAGAKVIVTVGTPATVAAKDATKIVPIVMVGVGDPVGLGIVDSVSKPGANITGTSFLAPDIVAKCLGLLREAK